VRRAPLIAGAVILGAAWTLAAAGHGVTGHMASHMAAVSVAAALLALGLAGTRFDPATRWPRIVGPLPMMLVELIVVWGWHVPALRAWATDSVGGLALEQVMFATTGLLLWSACLGTRDSAQSARRAAGIIALLLTMMHMTLLGVLVAIAPRVLFAGAGLTLHGVTLTPMADQHLGGVAMLLIGAGSYLLGGLALLSRLLTSRRPSIEHS
jgi:putative membrane protein